MLQSDCLNSVGNALFAIKSTSAIVSLFDFHAPPDPARQPLFIFTIHHQEFRLELLRPPCTVFQEGRGAQPGSRLLFSLGGLVLAEHGRCPRPLHGIILNSKRAESVGILMGETPGLPCGLAVSAVRFSRNSWQSVKVRADGAARSEIGFERRGNSEHEPDHARA